MKDLFSSWQITHEGRTMPLTSWARALGIDAETLYTRIKGGWSIKKAFSTPAAKVTK